MFRMCMFIPTPLNGQFPFTQMLINTLQVGSQIESRLPEVVQQTIHGTDARVDGRGFPVPSYGKEEERDQAETVVQDGVDSVQIAAFALVLADAIEELDLFDELVVVLLDIVRLDVGAAIALQQRQVVTDDEHAIEDGLLFRVQRYALEG